MLHVRGKYSCLSKIILFTFWFFGVIVCVENFWRFARGLATGGALNASHSTPEPCFPAHGRGLPLIDPSRTRNFEQI